MGKRSWKFYLTIVTIILLLSFFFMWICFLISPLKISANGYSYRVKPGSSFKMVATDLHNQHVLAHPTLFNFLVFITGQTHNLKAGEYAIGRETTPHMLIEQLTSNQGMILHAFRIIPGATFQQIRLSLNADVNLVHKSEKLTNDAIMKKLAAKGLSPEGQFYPETYFFVAGTTDFVILKQAYKAMQSKLTVAWDGRAQGLPFENVYQALTAASLVEKEAYLTAEKPLIASVLINRLRKKTLLQFDPTVIYGLGAKYKGDIHKQDLQDSTNLYNTYVFKGLPPTPIAMPGLDSINAVMHPDGGDYFYFVATGTGGAHHFSKTLPEHNEAVIKLRNYHPVPFNIGILKKLVVRGDLV